MLLWVVFVILITGMLVLDLGILHRTARASSTREAVLWSAAWIGISLLFSLGVFLRLGPDAFLEFITGYTVEKALSFDNIFVFILIFSYFRVESRFQHKVLFWGILGALVMRGIFIAAGIALIRKLHATLYVFGVLLIVAGGRLFFSKGKKVEPEKNPMLKLFRRYFRVTKDYQGSSFFIRRNSALYATPLFIALLVVETTDVVFALDSIPAIFAITQDPFIVYTSNIFAVLGLRALYFALGSVMRSLAYLHYGLSAVLVFVGSKMLIADFYRIPASTALAAVAGILAVTVAASEVHRKRGSG